MGQTVQKIMVNRNDQPKSTAENRRSVTTPPRTSPRRRMSFEEAKNATFAQYGEVLQRLADS